MHTVKRKWLTLDDLLGMAKWQGENDAHIAYDPDVVAQYERREGCSHDGTALFTVELAQRVLMPLMVGSSYFVPDGQPDGMVPRYTVGRIKHITIYGDTDMRERIIMPVRVEWVPTTN